VLVDQTWERISASELYDGIYSITYINYRVSAGGKQQVPIFRQIQTQHALLVGVDRQNEVVCLQRPSLGNESDRELGIYDDIK
jgi:hypothetical protein